MLDITKLILPLSVIAGGSDTVLLTDVSPIKEFINGKPTDKILGFRYSCVCPAAKYVAIEIRVEQSAPVITPEELEAKGGTIKAKVKGFEGRFFKNRDGNYIFTSKATGIEVG